MKKRDRETFENKAALGSFADLPAIAAEEISAYGRRTGRRSETVK